MMTLEDMVSAGTNCTEIPIELPAMLTGHINRNKPATHFIDHPKVSVLALRQRAETVVFVNLDILEIDTNLCMKIRETIAQKHGMAATSVIVTCTHTHTAPPAIKLGLLDMNMRFVEALTESISTSVEKAFSTFVACSVKVGMNPCTGVGVNRRKIINGNVTMGPNPEGIIDTDLTVCWFLDKRRKPVASIVNFSMHPTTLDVQTFAVSADYPQYVRNTINEQYPECTVLFFNGTCGDIRPNLLDERGDFRGGDVTDLVNIGKTIGKHALETNQDSAKCLSKTDIHIIDRTMELLYDFDLRKRQATKRKSPKGEYESKQINQTLMQDVFDEWEKQMPLGNIFDETIGFEISIITIGKALAIVSLPGEVFTQTGRDIKARSPYPFTMVVGYANETVGYIPTKDDYAYGGYEVEDAYKFYWHPAPFRMDTADRILQQVTELLNSSTGSEQILFQTVEEE
jgi:hypothetical protein